MAKTVKVPGYRGDDLAITPPRLRVLVALEAGDVIRTEKHKGWPRYTLKGGGSVQSVTETLVIHGLAHMVDGQPALTEAGRAALEEAKNRG
jgi:hypothetical protein